jgi:hypothetical protein
MRGYWKGWCVRLRELAAKTMVVWFEYAKAEIQQLDLFDQLKMLYGSKDSRRCGKYVVIVPHLR